MQRNLVLGHSSGEIGKRFGGTPGVAVLGFLWSGAYFLGLHDPGDPLVVDGFVCAQLLAHLLGQFLGAKGIVVITVNTTYVVGNLSVLGWQLRFVVIAVSGKVERPGQQAFGQYGFQTLVEGGAVWVSESGSTGYALPDA